MKKPKYHISANDGFVIENYNLSPAFSSFFPGIAGVFGCPMWVFYANRGQCITSAGVNDKDGAIMEFLPANKAYRTVSLTGFRTFIKIDGKFYEPFLENSGNKNEMRITPHDLTLVEENQKLKIRVEVNFFTIANEPYPALARTIKIINLSGKSKKVELLDGIPVIIPYGFADDLLKRISRTIESWCVVKNLDSGTAFCKLKVSPADVSETQLISKGNFFVSPDSSAVIVEPKLVFGETRSFGSPSVFIGQKNFSIPKKQHTQGFTPCAFAYKKLNIKAKDSFSLGSLLGQADSIAALNQIKKNSGEAGFFAKKAEENKKLVDSLCGSAGTQSASKQFDLYCRQNFLDNVMRGGFPVNIDGKIIYLYYRKHGDMERDYNNFKLMPTFYSQGNGNYRDINQNRRNDIFFNPTVADDNIKRFYNLVQLDGFNPLVVLGSQLYIKSKSKAGDIAAKYFKGKEIDLSKPFLLGPLLKLTASPKKAAEEIIEASEIEDSACHGEGFWIDHFSYNTDLLESFEAIYPERVKGLFFDKKIFSFFQNDHYVADRKEKYCLNKGNVRQYRSVRKSDKAAGPQKYKTTLAAKILTILVNKAASFDAEGIGLEMEAEKPDWYDALNGLPALFGSSLSETLELKRLAQYFKTKISDKSEVSLPAEVMEFINLLNNELSHAADPFKYWENSYKLKEAYRKKTRFGVSGKEERLSAKDLLAFLGNIINKCDRGIRKCLSKYKNYYTYFINEVTDYEKHKDKIEVKKFAQKPLPLFLEGFVHALKVEHDKKIYGLVKKSTLYDKALKMYKVNSPLEGEPIEIGRARIFTPGWLENESVWLHMEYKYMLELLKAGLYKEFFGDFKNVLIPFLDPKKYRRSILENSSFLVSSAHPNKDDHGRGFVARLSGASAEFIDIWIIMTTGKKVFSLDDNGKLVFTLSPILPKWLFKKDKFSFNLLGSIEVTYINKTKKNTFDGLRPVSYKIIFDSQEIELTKPYIPEPYSKMIRERKVKKIIVTLG
ncbi:MAG: cellobiose phosphorylase [Candidatus Margulisiibacteriota bacterium]|nr:cellobiose phosphorylase [Candidatus Margulisiibacteriota bacterium]